MGMCIPKCRAAVSALSCHVLHNLCPSPSFPNKQLKQAIFGIVDDILTTKELSDAGNCR